VVNYGREGRLVSAKKWYKRPALIAFVVVWVVLIVLLVRIHTYAWLWLSNKPMEKVEATEAAESYRLGLTMRCNLETIYYPHAEALLAAEERLGTGQEPGQILQDLSVLPGVKAAVLNQFGGEIFQYPVGEYPVSDLQSKFLDFREEAISYVHPMMKRKVGGLTRFVKWATGEDTLDLMVRYAEAEAAENMVLGLVLDAGWLLKQVPAFMDSLARENASILFWSQSPPELNEQAIGVTYEGDTLWWQGNRSLEIRTVHPAGLIEGLELHPRFHWIKEEKEVTERMWGIRNLFTAAEVLGVLLVILALFAIRPKSHA
jgi:hypothetical protein